MFSKLAINKHYNKLMRILVTMFVFSARKRRKIKLNLQNALKNSFCSNINNYISTNYADSYCIFSRYGLGDIFFVASLIKEFKKTHIGKVVYFTEKPHLVEFIKAFPSIDEVVVRRDFSKLQCEYYVQKDIKRGQLNVLFYPYRGKKKNYVFADNYSNLLNVPCNCERELPIFKETNYKNVKAEFEKLQINPDKTIVLIPEATMFNYMQLPSDFWIKLADKLIELGYDVVFNSRDEAFDKYKTTFLPVLDFCVFAKQVKHIISFRSGVNDLLVGLGITNLSVIYPYNFEVIWAEFEDLNMRYHKYHEMLFDNEFENILNIYSLNSNFPGNNIKEVFYQYNDEILLQELINF